MAQQQDLDAASVFDNEPGSSQNPAVARKAAPALRSITVTVLRPCNGGQEEYAQRHTVPWMLDDERKAIAATVVSACTGGLWIPIEPSQVRVAKVEREYFTGQSELRECAA